MINLHFINKILKSSHCVFHNKRTFQLCLKNNLYFTFSNSKNTKNTQQSTQNTQSVSSKQQPKQKIKNSIERLRIIKQQQRQQQYQNKLNQINLTSGSFNPFTNYLWIHRRDCILVLIGLVIAYALINENSLFCYKTMGPFKDPFTNKKKFLVINPYRQSMLQKYLLKLIQKQVTFLSNQSINDKNSQINKTLQKKLQNVLTNLEKKYGIKFRVLAAESEQSLFIWVIGDDKLVISTKLLRLSSQNLQNVILLMHSLHSRYLHVQRVSFWQRMNLKTDVIDTKKIIKLDKTFISNVYNGNDIQETIDLLSRKYGTNQQQKTQIKLSIQKTLKQLLSNNKSVLNSITQFDIRNKLNDFTKILN